MERSLLTRIDIVPRGYLSRKKTYRSQPGNMLERTQEHFDTIDGVGKAFIHAGAQRPLNAIDSFARFRVASRVGIHVGRRVPGLHAGSITMAPDFDQPLPDEFWTGMP